MSDESSALPRRSVVLLFLTGVALPVATIVLELVYRLCAGALFDPMPSLLHVLLVAAVPSANAYVLWMLMSSQPKDLRWAGPINGGAIAISLFYSVLFAPITPIAVVGIFFQGLGLLALAPLFSLIAALRLRVHLSRRAKVEAGKVAFWPGFFIALALLVGIDLPATLTRVGLEWADSDSPAVRDNGIRWLRVVGNENILLRHCYSRTGMSTDMLGALFIWGTPVAPEKAQAIYYRVTGKAYNAVPRPQIAGNVGGWRARVRNFDSQQGGDAVGGQLDGLTLAASRIDGSFDAEAAVAYLEWTLLLRNDASLQREARAQIALPPGAVISRLTLWIDGEEREAAFAGTREVRQAYEKVVRRQQDPVLVTRAGQDRALVQLFPVPPQGEMKVRIGITVPALTPTIAESVLPLPYFHERNFALPAGFRHAVWIDAKAPLHSDGAQSIIAESRHSLRAQWDDARLASAAARIGARRSGDGNAWATDRTDRAYRVRQTLHEQPGKVPAQLFVVADASASMQGAAESLADALKSLPSEMRVTLLFAEDRASVSPIPGETLAAPMLADRLRKFDYAGGHDNLPALMRAVALAGNGDDRAILWLHGPQPVRLGSVEPLLQASERQTRLPAWYDVQVTPGPNQIVEAISGATPGRIAGVSLRIEDLPRLLAGWRGEGRTVVRTLERFAKPSGEVDAVHEKTSDHLARLWANEEIHRLMNVPGRRADAVRLAQRYQLVTPVSGAVVLETKQQFDEAGLEPVRSGSVPTIPEPETWMLISVALSLLAYRARRAGQRSGHVPV